MSPQKRIRDEDNGDNESSGSSSPETFPAAKRFQPDTIIEIFDEDSDDADSGHRSSVSDMVKGLEEEISKHEMPPELGYLLEASDDELGLPPPPPPPAAIAGGESPATEEMKSWGFGEDEFVTGCYEDYVGFGFRYEDGSVTGVTDDYGVVFDGGLFDYGDVAFCEPLDFEWRIE